MLNINHLLLFFQIKREISTMKLIKHPNVVQLHEVYYCCLSDVMMQVSLLPFDDPTTF
jgi:serine/threonine protein kinase